MGKAPCCVERNASVREGFWIHLVTGKGFSDLNHVALVRVKTDAVGDTRDADKGRANHNYGEDDEVPAFRDEPMWTGLRLGNRHISQIPLT